jgi:DNA topoisomerase I
MSQTLVIVESPGKITKISSYLGDDYIVKASFGHCRDLDKKTLSIEVENNFNPLYLVIPDKRKVISELKLEAKRCKEVILAADEDREGEMIAAGLRDLLKLKNPKRIVFHEITKKAINDAVKNPSVINENMVMAQQTRRLLDRLVGYKLSPLLWKKVQGESSAGRVQSVVIKIIIDKENEIKKSVSEPYFKTQGIFNFKGKKLNTVLMKNKDIYKFSSEKNIISLLNTLNSLSVCKTTDVSNKEIIRKPPAPFITSTMQQDASTKFHYNSKKTMMLAQKLYEAGMITYMRTDSTNLSNEALQGCKQYIEKTYGEIYHKKRTYCKKSKNAQEAHEAIRPTKLSVSEFNKLGVEGAKLYNLIWKRTVASQMADAKINIMTISIDILNNNKTLLPDKTYFVTNYENILFDGFLLLYNNHESDNEKGKFNINLNQILDYISVKVTEEYTKPPLRYNEAGLIKYLEKNGIGRPSTYASIMSKIIDKKYVLLQNIDGISKTSKQYIVLKANLNKNNKIKKENKEIKIGSEKNKLVPTETGIKINNFLCEHFDCIMDITFTAKMEKLLDKVATGKAIWYNVLSSYYDMFNPIVENIAESMKKIDNTNKTDKFIGVHPETNEEIFSMIGKYGLCVKIKENDKWKFSSIKEYKQDEITLDIAVEALEYPKFIGKHNKTPIYLNKGQYGLYFKMGSQFVSIDDEEKQKSLEHAKLLFNNIKNKNSIKTFKINNKTYNLKNGQYGYYLQVFTDGKNKPTNIPLGNNINPDKITKEKISVYLNKNL